MNRGRQGRLLRRGRDSEGFKAFVPFALPPDPPVQVDPDLLDEANRALGRLDAVTLLLPDPSFFLYFYVRREAVFSSQIAGNRSSLWDLLMHEYQEAPGVPVFEVEEVAQYVEALHYGLQQLKSGTSLSLELIRQIHGVLLSKGLRRTKTPGEYRRAQNWTGATRTGGAKFFPPPPEEIAACMVDLEKFLHDQPTRTPSLLKVALSHVQFDTIYPFLNGNGRLGRILITLLLCSEGALSEPLLYLSLYFKEHRDTYYNLLQRVRLKGDWEAWVTFFLKGVIETAEQALKTAQRISALFTEDMARVVKMNRVTKNISLVYSYLRKKHFLEIPTAADDIGITQPTVGTAIGRLQRMGIVREITGRARFRVFVYKDCLEILEEGTQPLPATSHSMFRQGPG